MVETEWIIVTNSNTGRKHAINLDHVIYVSERDKADIGSGKKADIVLSNSGYVTTSESFDEIGAMIR